jgi:hypothetical protein
MNTRDSASAFPLLAFDAFIETMKGRDYALTKGSQRPWIGQARREWSRRISIRSLKLANSNTVPKLLPRVAALVGMAKDASDYQSAARAILIRRQPDLAAVRP